MSEEERLQLENECLMKYSKAQMIQKYIDELEESSKLSELWCKSQQENKQLKKHLEYLRNGGYYNQLRFENKMLQDIVDNGEVSKEDKEFIDCTHRNTELLEQQEEFINYMMNTIENITQDETDDEEIKAYLIQRGNTFKEILSKYKEIGSVIKVCSGSQDVYNYEK